MPCTLGANAALEGAVTLEIEGAAAPRVAAPPVAKRRRAARWLRWLKLVPLALVAAVAVRQLRAPLPARTHVVDRGDVVGEVYGRATVESRREVELGFDLVGRISDVLVDEGDRVEIGQVVAHLAPEQVKADVEAAASGESLAKAAIARLAADERRARAALAFSELEATRTRTLAAAGTVSARDLDLAEQQLTLARADLDRVRAMRVEAQRGIAVASGAVESKAATATRAVLVSPFDGVVTRRFKDPGDTVIVGSTVLRIVAVDRLWARAAIDESMVGGLREGMRAEIALLGATGAPLDGHVDRVGREVDRQTHEILVDVLLPEVPTPLAIGHRADVHIEVERHADVVRLPIAFLKRDARGPFAYLDHDGRVARVDLELGIVGRDFVEVLGGLEPGAVVLDAAGDKGNLQVGRGWSGS
jgi:HlyD family secretion protein